MAKTRSGLGRGLGALLGDEPYAPAPEKPQAPAPQATPVQKSASSESLESPKPEVKSSRPATMSEKLEERNQNRESIKRSVPERSQPQAQKPADSKPGTEGRSVVVESVDTRDIRAALREEHKNVRSYIEEDDHVTIKSVVARERKTDNTVDISLVKPNPDQPRTRFNEEELEELADSIRKNGLLQPILVRKKDEGYQIIAGERRWQAATRAGVKKVPVNVIDADDDKVIELALIENIQRSDLNPIEEAYGYKRLMERKGMTQAEVAMAVSKGRSTIANSLRLLDLPYDAQQLLFDDQITAGHARAILSVPTKEGKQSLTDKIVNNKLSVREAENIARLLAGRKSDTPAPARTPIPKEYKVVAKSMAKSLGLPVRVKSAKGKNKIEIEFKDQAELEELFERFGQA